MGAAFTGSASHFNIFSDFCNIFDRFNISTVDGSPGIEHLRC